MHAHTRRAIAYITGRLGTGKAAAAVYDHDEGATYDFSGEVSGDRINVYDNDESCYVTGTLPSLYHDGDGQYIDLRVKDADFTGYDHATGQYFDVKVKPGSVSIYDHETGQYHDFSV